jgi:hypothetical protein
VKRIKILTQIAGWESWLFKEARRKNPSLTYSRWVECGMQREAWSESCETRQRNDYVRDWVKGGGLKKAVSNLNTRRSKKLGELLADNATRPDMLNEDRVELRFVHPSTRTIN